MKHVGVYFLLLINRIFEMYVVFVTANVNSRGLLICPSFPSLKYCCFFVERSRNADTTLGNATGWVINFNRWLILPLGLQIHVGHTLLLL